MRHRHRAEIYIASRDGSWLLGIGAARPGIAAVRVIDFQFDESARQIIIGNAYNLEHQLPARRYRRRENARYQTPGNQKA